MLVYIMLFYNVTSSSLSHVHPKHNVTCLSQFSICYDLICLWLGDTYYTRVNTHYHNVDLAFLVYHVPGIYEYTFKLSFIIIW